MPALDLSLAIGLLLLGMGLGALLTRIRVSGTVPRIVHEELESVEKQRVRSQATTNYGS
jgi:hypothetical protein